MRADDPALAASAAAALRQAGGVESRRLDVGGAKPAAALNLTRGPDSLVEARFDEAFPLSPAGREVVLRTLERDDTVRRLSAQSTTAPLAIRQVSAAPAAASSTAAAPGRFVLVMLLWLPLTGSLGMLLQAVVRERANRALESLLAAAQPWEIVFGKLAGVGAVSVLVMAAWLCAGALAGSGLGAGGAAAAVLGELARPVLLAKAAAVYLLAYLFYGLVTVAVGATAQDTASSQNYSRPMFMVLLAAFFTAMAAASGAGGLGWLVYAPPFTPFMLLLGAHSPAVEVGTLGLLAAAAAVAGWLAVRSVGLQPGALLRSRTAADKFQMNARAAWSKVR